VSATEALEDGFGGYGGLHGHGLPGNFIVFSGALERERARDMGRIELVGVVLGTVASLAVARLIAALSGYLPARRASQIDPIAALRSN